MEALPTVGLENHEFLRYLLLENNKIKRLPYEIANLRHLTALNLIDNPIEYPPIEVVQKGCKCVQEYLKHEIKKGKNYLISCSNDEYEFADENYNNIKLLNDDVWASDDNENNEDSNGDISTKRSKLSSASIVSQKNKLLRLNSIVNSDSSYTYLRE